MNSEPTPDTWSIVRCLREDGIEMYLKDGRLFSREPVTDPDAIAHIKQHRAAIIEELSNA